MSAGALLFNIDEAHVEAQNFQIIGTWTKLGRFGKIQNSAYANFVSLTLSNYTTEAVPSMEVTNNSELRLRDSKIANFSS
jgi:hypothetical protein